MARVRMIRAVKPENSFVRTLILLIFMGLFPMFGGKFRSLKGDEKWRILAEGNAGKSYIYNI